MKIPHTEVTKPKGRKRLPLPMCLSRSKETFPENPKPMFLLSHLARVEPSTNGWPVKEIVAISLGQQFTVCGLWTLGCPKNYFRILASENICTKIVLWCYLPFCCLYVPSDNAKAIVGHTADASAPLKQWHQTFSAVMVHFSTTYLQKV